ncbi:MAG: hypothetical protein WC763_05855 [Candidatus Paceibacterota bacterium]|jgi:hypothetical protein
MSRPSSPSSPSSAPPPFSITKPPAPASVSGGARGIAGVAAPVRSAMPPIMSYPHQQHQHQHQQLHSRDTSVPPMGFANVVYNNPPAPPSTDMNLSDLIDVGSIIRVFELFCENNISCRSLIVAERMFDHIIGSQSHVNVDTLFSHHHQQQQQQQQRHQGQRQYAADTAALYRTQGDLKLAYQQMGIYPVPIFDPHSDGSCLFSAAIAGISSKIPSLANEWHDHQQRVLGLRKEIALAILDEFDACETHASKIDFLQLFYTSLTSVATASSRRRIPSMLSPQQHQQQGYQQQGQQQHHHRNYQLSRTSLSPPPPPPPSPSSSGGGNNTDNKFEQGEFARELKDVFFNNHIEVFRTWLTTRYASDVSICGGEMELRLIAKTAGVNIVVVMGNTSRPTLLEDTCRLLPGSLMGHLLALNFYCDPRETSVVERSREMTRRAQHYRMPERTMLTIADTVSASARFATTSMDDYYYHGEAGDEHVEKEEKKKKKIKMCEENRTIVLQHMGDHYQLLGVADASQWEWIICMSALVRHVLALRADRASITNRLDSTSVVTATATTTSPTADNADDMSEIEARLISIDEALQLPTLAFLSFWSLATSMHRASD